MARGKQSKLNKLMSGQNVAFLFMAPWIIGLCLFFVYPFFSSIHLSFSRVASLFGYKLETVGLKNFEKILFEDVEFIPALLKSIQQTLIFVPSIVILSMILAVFLNSKIKMRGLFRSIYFLPVLLGTGYVMAQLLGQGNAQAAAQSAQTLSRGLEIPAGLSGILGSEMTEIVKAVFDNITMILWKCGVQIVIFLSGLQSISPALYESSRVDGATEWEMYWKITMPMLAPVTVMTVVYTIISTFTDLANPVIEYMLRVGKDLRSAGPAAAMSWIYLLLVLVITLVVLFVSRRSADGNR